MTLEMAWMTRPLQLVLSGGPVTPTPIIEYNGLRGENRGPGPAGFSMKSRNEYGTQKLQSRKTGDKIH